MLQLNSALLATAAEFTGQYSPYQAIEISPANGGGVFVASTDKGNIACLGFDGQGTADETIHLLPSTELIRAARGIKSAPRGIEITGITPGSHSAMAKVTTYMKSASKAVEVPIQLSGVDFPPLAKTMQAVLERWGKAPSSSDTAGRYDATYLNKAIKALGGAHASITFSCFDGGPLRLQSPDQDVVILVMPQTADPIPPVPDWLEVFSAR